VTIAEAIKVAQDGLTIIAKNAKHHEYFGSHLYEINSDDLLKIIRFRDQLQLAHDDAGKKVKKNNPLYDVCNLLSTYVVGEYSVRGLIHAKSYKKQETILAKLDGQFYREKAKMEKHLETLLSENDFDDEKIASLKDEFDLKLELSEQRLEYVKNNHEKLELKESNYPVKRDNNDLSAFCEFYLDPVHLPKDEKKLFGTQQAWLRESVPNLIYYVQAPVRLGSLDAYFNGEEVQIFGDFYYKVSYE
jgi:hypothetical protein